MSTNDVPGLRVDETLGMVIGECVQARDFLSDAGSDLKSLVGGELVGATKMLVTAREVALERMQSNARALGATAVVGVRLVSDNLGSGRSQSAAVVAFGTAVRLAKEEPGEGEPLSV